MKKLWERAVLLYFLIIHNRPNFELGGNELL